MATISTPEYLIDQAKRRFQTSPMLTVPGMGLLEKRLLAHDWPQHAMAQPPVGSDLKAVMGDSGLPIVGHMTPIEASGEVNGHLAALVRRHLVVGPGPSSRRPEAAATS